MIIRFFLRKKRLVAVFASILIVTALFRVIGADMFSERITPNKLTIEWADKSAPNITIDTFRIRGYNVAQLRTMVDVCGGTVIQLSDGSYQITKTSGGKVQYAPISFEGETNVKVQYNVTPIRNIRGELFIPQQPGWVFLAAYEYNWCSIRDVLNAMELEIQSYTDDPIRRATHVIIGKPFIYPGLPPIKTLTPCPTVTTTPPSITVTPTITSSQSLTVTPTITSSQSLTVTPTITSSAALTVTPTETVTPVSTPSPTE